MRILLIIDPHIPVPPDRYGGIERVVADLAAGLVSRGHDVTLWASPGSSTPARLRTFGRQGEWTRWSNIRNSLHITLRLWREIGSFDIIHNFGRLAYLTGILPLSIPKIQTYMRRVNPANMRKVALLGGRNIHFTAVSARTRDTGAPGGGEWSVIYNCAPIDRYRLTTDVDPDSAPLVFLGRLERCKGAHTAIAVARALGRPLEIAGNISPLPEEIEYFHNEIEPQLDGKLISYVGTVDDAEKNRFLGSAAAMLLPIQWEEPFPVILPESLLCGTPIIAFRRGGVPEGIDHGRTGFLCDTLEEMIALVPRIREIDRRECRAEAERRFSDTVIVGEYEKLYSKMLRPLGGRSPEVGHVQTSN
jgi:glycosyltransferase involved in cell wall biosynthesis